MKDNLAEILFYLAIAILAFFLNGRKRKKSSSKVVKRGGRAYEKKEVYSSSAFSSLKKSNESSSSENHQRDIFQNMDRSNILESNHLEKELSFSKLTEKEKSDKINYLDNLLERSSLMDLIVFSEIINNPYL